MNLRFSYPDGRQALRAVSFTLRPGEKVAILGPNGAGTCLNWHDNRKLPQPIQVLSIVRNPHKLRVSRIGK